MKILFWVPYPSEGQSNRFRVEQYLPYLRKKGIAYSLNPFWESEVYKILYENGHYLKKTYYFIRGTINRIRDLVNLSDYDLVFVHREAYPVGGAFLEKIAFSKKPIIYDFDDSVFLPTHSSANRIMHWLKKPRKITNILKMSAAIIAGNNYLKEYAMQYNKNTAVIPTLIDTGKYSPAKDAPGNNHKVIVGWIGSYTNNQYLNMVRTPLLDLINKYGDSIEIRLIGCRNNFLNIPGITYCNWSLSTEINELQGFDIGIMPIWDDDWTRGKCAFKIVQYMSVGASVVASPVGVNKEIIKDGVNGFFAANEKEWFEKLCLLIENPQLRRKFALEGRHTVEKEYSLELVASKFIDVLERVYEDKRK
ncbi:MAG: glycosyltransferase family 4 protein [Candidatus Omnitrophota bacterium]